VARPRRSRASSGCLPILVGVVAVAVVLGGVVAVLNLVQAHPVLSASGALLVIVGGQSAG
jgi:hypothetical protein